MVAIEKKVSMKKISVMRTAAGAAAAAATIAGLGYAALAGSAWLRFGRAPRARTLEEQDPLLEIFMPRYDVVERHHIAIDAPAAVTVACARNLDSSGACLSRVIFKARELAFGAEAVELPAGGMVAVMQRIGWGILAEEPGREIVLGAVTRPWEANPVFRSVPAGDFAGFNEPGYVKIAVTLRADSVGDAASVFRTETRAVATDARARTLFRRYWAMVSPGVALIRVAMLKPIKAAAEREFQVAT
jgi:hypothetical protein